MLGHGGSSAGSYLADPTSPIPSHCAVIMYYIRWSPIIMLAHVAVASRAVQIADQEMP